MTAHARAARPSREHLLLIALAAVLLAVATPACAPDPDPDPCPAIIYPSVRVTVVDPTGAVVQDARVTAVVDGKPATSVSCVPDGLASPCPSWQINDAGRAYVVRATYADGTGAVEKNVEVIQRGSLQCSNPDTQSIEIALPQR